MHAFTWSFVCASSLWCNVYISSVCADLWNLHRYLTATESVEFLFLAIEIFSQKNVSLSVWWFATISFSSVKRFHVVLDAYRLPKIKLLRGNGVWFSDIGSNKRSWSKKLGENNSRRLHHTCFTWTPTSLWRNRATKGKTFDQGRSNFNKLLLPIFHE